jgi:hypothetical protein
MLVVARQGEEPTMTSTAQHMYAPPDLFSLAEASMAELAAALEDDETFAGDEHGAPSRARQIGELIVAEAVRLIRLGTRTELSGAAVELAKTLAGPKAEELEERHPEAHMLASAASITLGAATSPSSGGSELTVLRAWGGKALEAVSAISQTDRDEMPRAQLRACLGDLDESHMSHFLADLEASGLIVRIREGRTVTVRLGSAAQSRQVRELLPGTLGPSAWTARGEEAELTQLSSAWASPRFNPEPGDDSRLWDLNLELSRDSEALPEDDALAVTREFAMRSNMLRTHARPADAHSSGSAAPPPVVKR